MDASLTELRRALELDQPGWPPVWSAPLEAEREVLEGALSVALPVAELVGAFAEATENAVFWRSLPLLGPVSTTIGGRSVRLAPVSAACPPVGSRTRLFAVPLGVDEAGVVSLGLGPRPEDAALDELLLRLGVAPSAGHRAALRRALGRVVRSGGERFVQEDLAPRWTQALKTRLGGRVMDGELEAEQARAALDAAAPLIASAGRVHAARYRAVLGPARVERIDWLVSLGHLPDHVWSAILGSSEQIARWERALGDVAWSLEALRQRPWLVVDTALLDPATAQAVAAVARELDPSGLAIRGEARRALATVRALREPVIDCVFIDPPYNTGTTAFDYRDRFSQRAWWSLMRGSLGALHPMLGPQGVVFATIDDGQVHRLRLLMQSQMDPVGHCIWHKKYARQNDAAHFSVSHDHVLVAARDASTWRSRRLPRTTFQDRHYTNRDDDPRGPWQSVVYTCNKTAEQRPNLYYPVIHPITGEDIWPARSRVWACSPETHQRHRAEGRLWWGKGKPRLKKFLSELDGGLVPTTIWGRELAGDNRDAVHELMDLGLPAAFTSPKPTRLVQLVLRLGCPTDGTVLDFFAGSGTTAHATLALNREDGGRRRFVVIEPGAHFEDVLLPRLCRVLMSSRWKKGRPQPGLDLPGPVEVWRLECAC